MSLCSGVNVIEYVAPDAAVIVRGFAVEASFQLANLYRVSGPPCGVLTDTVQAVPFVQTTFAGVEYAPVGQPVPDTLNCAKVLAPKLMVAGYAEKFAASVVAEFIVTANGFAELTMSPLHPVN
jgi:hypothetical protein